MAKRSALAILVASATLAYAGCFGVALPSGDVDAGPNNAPPSDDPPSDAGPVGEVEDFSAWEPLTGSLAPCEARIPGASGRARPFTWETCPDYPNLPGVTCRKLALDWDAPGIAEIGVRTRAVVHESGKVTLFGAKRYKNGFVTFVADADGPLSTAIYMSPEKCLADSHGGSRTHYAFSVQVRSGSERPFFVAGGAIGSPAPTLVERAPWSENTQAGRGGIVHRERFAVEYPWDGGARIEYPLPSLTPGHFTTWDDLVVRHSGPPEKVDLFSNELGVVPFAGFGGDDTKGAGELTTDGRDWVWTEASGRPKSGGAYATVSIMTAPFGRDPSQLERRVVRTDPTTYAFPASLVVGCKRAARGGAVQLPDGTWTYGIQVVDLETGEGWSLESGSVAIVGPTALTCDELFFVGSEARARLTMHRVRLDSLSKLAWPKTR